MGSSVRLPAALAGARWTLRQYEHGGALRAAPDTPREVVLRFGRGRMGGNDGCNNWGAPVGILGGRLIIGGRATTDMACPGIVEFLEMVHGVFSGEAGWEVRDQLLIITGSDGTRLIYEPRASIYPSDRPGYPAPAVLLEVSHRSGDLRMSYRVNDSQISLLLEYRDSADDGIGQSFTSLSPERQGPQPDPMSCMNTAVDGDRFIAGLVSGDVAQVTFRLLGTDREVDLPLYGLVGTRIRVFGGFVGNPLRGSQIVAYDAVGVEMGPLYAPYWWISGDPI